jgi:hypothetical protein
LVNGKLEELVKKMQEAAGVNLESVILYGSAARGDYRETYSDLNVLCAMGSLGAEELARVAPVVKWWCTEKREPAPLFFSREELQQSSDIFPIELLDMQESHRVLYGPDVVAGISVPMNLHRVQVERDLRIILLKLRQHFLHRAKNQKELAGVFAKSVCGVLTLLRHTLIAFDEKPPAGARELFARIAAITGADATAFEAVMEYRETRKVRGDVFAVYGAYLRALENVIRALDQQIPKREWRRVGTTQT